MQKIIILSLILLFVPFCSDTMETNDAAALEAIRPCSEDECMRFCHEFEKRRCDHECRKAELEKLAQDFDIKRDGDFLRALLCADKKKNVYIVKNAQQAYGSGTVGGWPKGYWIGHCRPHDRTIYFYQKLSFINTAIERNNLNFMKVFFRLCSHGGSTLLFFEGLCSPMEYDAYKEMLLPQKAAVAEEDMTKLLFENTKTDPLKLHEAIQACEEDAKQRLLSLHGCSHFRQLAQEIRDQEKGREERMECNRAQFLRDVVNSAKI